MGLGVESKLGDSIVTTRLDHAVNWGRSYSYKYKLILQIVIP